MSGAAYRRNESTWTMARFKAAWAESLFDTQVLSSGIACAALSTILTWLTLLTGGREDEEGGVESVCYIFGCTLGFVVGVLLAMLIKSEYPIHETISFWAGMVVMGSLWTLFIPPFWDKVLYPYNANFSLSAIDWTTMDWVVVVGIINASLSLGLPAGMTVDYFGERWGPCFVGVAGGGLIASGYMLEGLVSGWVGKNMTISAIAGLIIGQGHACAYMAVMCANIPRFAVVNWGKLSGVLQCCFSLASLSWMLMTWTFFGNSPAQSATYVLLFERRIPMGVAVAACGLAFYKPSRVEKYRRERPNTAHLYGFPHLPTGILIYGLVALSAGMAIEMFALQPPSLLVAPIAAALWYEIPLLLVIMYGVAVCLKPDLPVCSGSKNTTTISSGGDAAAAIAEGGGGGGGGAAAGVEAPVWNSPGAKGTISLWQVSLVLAVLCGSGHTLASYLYDMGSHGCLLYIKQSSSTTDIYWLGRATTSLYVGYRLDRLTNKIGPGPAALQYLMHASWIMTASMFAMAVFESADSVCIFSVFYLVASGGLGVSIGIVWTILPVLALSVKLSGPGGTELPFGRLLGTMTIGPSVGIVVFFIFIAQWTNTFGWCWIQFACCLVTTAWTWKKAMVSIHGTSEMATGDRDREPLLPTPKRN